MKTSKKESKQQQKKVSQDKKQVSQDKKAQKKSKKVNLLFDRRKFWSSFQDNKPVKENAKIKNQDKPAKDEAVVEEVIVADEPVIDVATEVEPVAYEYVYDAASSSELVEEIATVALVASKVDETVDESSSKKKKEGGKKKGKKNKEE
jgi:hypothetical protein